MFFSTHMCPHMEWSKPGSRGEGSGFCSLVRQTPLRWDMISLPVHHGSDKYKRPEELKFLDSQNQIPWW